MNWKKVINLKTDKYDMKMFLPAVRVALYLFTYLQFWLIVHQAILRNTDTTLQFLEVSKSKANPFHMDSDHWHQIYCVSWYACKIKKWFFSSVMALQVHVLIYSQHDRPLSLWNHHWKSDQQEGFTQWGFHGNLIFMWWWALKLKQTQKIWWKRTWSIHWKSYFEMSVW